MKLFETIRVENGRYLNLGYHIWRFNLSRRKLGFNTNISFSLPKPPSNSIFRAKITYSQEIENIEFFPYSDNRSFSSFQIVFADEVNYDLKYFDRKIFDDLKKNIKADDILIIKNGFITDTSIANILFFDCTKWITPKKPLLKGTVRERLLRMKLIFEEDISLEDLKNFKAFAITNAMLGVKKIGSGDILKYFKY